MLGLSLVMVAQYARSGLWGSLSSDFAPFWVAPSRHQGRHSLGPMNPYHNARSANPMTSQHLSHVTLETLENCRNAATQGVLAYRSGSRRLIGAVNGALEQRVYPRTAKLAPRTTEFMNGLRGDVTQIAIKGLERSATRATKAIELGATTAGTQVNKLAQFAAAVDNAVVADSLQTAARLAMPGAKLALAISGKVAAGAVALADAAGARPLRSAARKAAAAPRRVVKRAAKAAPAQARAMGRAAKKAVTRAARG